MMSGVVYDDLWNKLSLWDQGEQVAQLLLDHSQHDECKDVAAFRRDMGNIVMEARRQTIKLGKVRQISRNKTLHEKAHESFQKKWDIHCL